MKRMLCIVLAFLLCLGTVSVAFANTDKSAPAAHAEIAQSLSRVEPNKELVGLENVDFSNLAVGNEIKLYEYTTVGFVELRSSYPLFYQGEIVALAIETDVQQYQIAAEIGQLINELQLESLAVVYDRVGVYAYDGQRFYLLKENPLEVENRLSVSIGSVPDTTAITVSNLGNGIPLNYVSNPNNNTRSGVMASCAINHVSQLPYKNICWAAVIASIVNFRNGTNLTAAKVAQNYYGLPESSFNQGLQNLYVQTVLESYGVYGYQFYSAEFPDAGIIYNNLNAGYPLYTGIGNGEDAWHAVTVFSIHMLDGYVIVMDPLEANYQYSYYANGVFSYYSPTMGMNVELMYACCRYWS